VDPIQAIKIEYGIQDTNFFRREDEVVLAGPFSKVGLFFTDK